MRTLLTKAALGGVILAGLLGGLLAGCASVPKDAGFESVQSAVAERSGQRVQWNARTADDRAVASTVRAMLTNGIDADRAVQIALLNNRRLQATYEDLGVAQAEV